MVRSSPLADREPPSLVPQRTETLHSRTRHVGGSAGVARQRREAWPGDHPSLGKLLQTQLAPRACPWLSVPLESLASALDGAADRVGKKGFAEKGSFYCNYLESESQEGGGGGSTIN